MLPIENNIMLDFSNNIGTNILVHQYENKGREVKVGFTNNGKVEEISNGDTILVGIKKPDGKVVYPKVTLNDDNTISFTIDENVSSIVGKCKCDIQVTDGESDIKTSVFYITVKESATTPTDVESNYDFSRMNQMIENCAKIIAMVDVATIQETKKFLNI